MISEPIDNIYKFEGVLEYDDHKEPISLENTIWANTVLAHKKVIGNFLINLVFK